MSFVLPCSLVVVIHSVISGISAGAVMSQNDTVVVKSAYTNISKYKRA